jgi:hypothetical protein
MVSEGTDYYSALRARFCGTKVDALCTLSIANPAYSKLTPAPQFGYDIE